MNPAILARVLGCSGHTWSWQCASAGAVTPRRPGHVFPGRILCPDHGLLFWAGGTACVKALRPAVPGDSCSAATEAVKSVPAEESLRPRPLTSGLTFSSRLDRPSSGLNGRGVL